MVFQLDFTGGKYGQRTPANKSRHTSSREEKYRARIVAATADAMRLPKRRGYDTCIGVGVENIGRYRFVFRERVTILILPGEFDEFMREHVTPGIVESLYYVE